MTNLSDLFPAGAGKQVSFVASGTLSSGQAVGLTSDGKVKALSAAIGAEDIYSAAATYPAYNSIYDSNAQKVVVPYDSGGAGKAVVATITGTSVSHGTAVATGTGSAGYISGAFDSSTNNVVIVCQDYPNSQYGTATVGTVAGTSITFGTPVVFNSDKTYYTATVFDSSNNRIVIGYRSGQLTGYGTAIVGTVSGTAGTATISFGSATAFDSTGIINYISGAFDSNSNKVVFCYQDEPASYNGTAIVGTVTTSPDAISFGSSAEFLSSDVTSTSTTFDSNNNKIVVVYRDDTTTYGNASVGTVSGTSITFGTAANFSTTHAQTPSVAFDTSANQVIIVYRNAGASSIGQVINGTVSGTSITFGTAVNFSSQAVNYALSPAYDANANKTLISFQQNPNDYGTSVVFDLDSFAASNFIGITDAAISDTASGNVTIKGGISTNVTGLTPASDYYVQDDGTISTVSSSVKAGKALSATAINLEYTS